MKVIHSQLANTDRFLIDGFYITDDSVDLLSDKLVALYAGLQSIRQGQAYAIVLEFQFLSTHARSVLAQMMMGVSTWCRKQELHQVYVEWRYDYMDEYMEEFGELLEEITELSFHFVQTEVRPKRKAY